MRYFLHRRRIRGAPNVPPPKIPITYDKVFEELNLLDFEGLKGINNFKWTDFIPGFSKLDSPLLYSIHHHFKIKFKQSAYNTLNKDELDSIDLRLNYKSWIRFLFGNMFTLQLTIIASLYFRSQLFVAYWPTFIPTVCFLVSVWDAFDYIISKKYAFGSFAAKLKKLSDEEYVKLLGFILAEDSLIDKLFDKVGSLANLVVTNKRPNKEVCRKALEKMAEVVKQDKEGPAKKGPKIEPLVDEENQEESKEKASDETKAKKANEKFIIDGFKKIFKGPIYKLLADEQVFGEGAYFLAAFGKKIKLGAKAEQCRTFLSQGSVGTNNQYKVKHEKNEIVINVKDNIKPIAKEYKAQEFCTWVERVMGDKDKASIACEELFKVAGKKEGFRGFLIFEKMENHKKRGF